MSEHCSGDKQKNSQSVNGSSPSDGDGDSVSNNNSTITPETITTDKEKPDSSGPSSSISSNGTGVNTGARNAASTCDELDAKGENGDLKRYVGSKKGKEEEFKGPSEEDQRYAKLLEQMTCSKCTKLMELPIYENSDYQRICGNCYDKLPMVPSCCKCESKVEGKYFTVSSSAYCTDCYIKFCKVGCMKRVCKDCTLRLTDFYSFKDTEYLYCANCKGKHTHCGQNDFKWQSVPECVRCLKKVKVGEDSYVNNGNVYCNECYKVTGFGGIMHTIFCSHYEQKEEYARSFYLQSLIDLIYYPCCHAGCEAKIKLALRDEHEEACRMRKVKCCFCKWEGELRKYQEHAEALHAFSFTDSNQSESKGLVFALKLLQDGQKHNYLQIIDGKMFKINCSLIDSESWFWIQCYGSKTEAARYRFTFFLESDGWKIQKEAAVVSDLETEPTEGKLPNEDWMDEVGLLSEKGTIIKFKITKIASGGSADVQVPKTELLNVE